MLKDDKRFRLSFGGELNPGEDVTGEDWPVGDDLVAASPIDTRPVGRVIGPGRLKVVRHSLLTFGSNR